MDNKPNQVAYLKSINFGSGDWAQFESFLRGELDDCYKSLAKAGKNGLSWEETLEMRGRAAYINRLLDLKRMPAVSPQL